ncbi:alpha/beta hydrolase family protein [Mangrovicella endophytica]|uniref:alpha/beta hydrolase family protein n=1 Tax=Mangrovicella endophytica TaxID=2066697 RepID=UPI000C9E9BE4|nr:alpha/beta fold hydrolase [Mangrovicella endophytica]
MADSFAVAAADGVPIVGLVHRPAAGTPRAVVVISAATSVQSRYYGRFAAYLADRGFAVVTYDYRGIGLSKPQRLRGFAAGWLDWGRLDLDAVLGHVAAAFPGRAVAAVGHSIGGFVTGLSPRSGQFTRIVTVGAQFARWRDYHPRHRHRMLAKWHLAMPLLTRAFGYFPGSRLGWMEDTPAGVVRDWSGFGRGFETSLDRPDALGSTPRQALAAVTAPILAIGLDDDPFGTVPAIERLLALYPAAPSTHLRIDPADIGAAEIGHFAFFHDRFKESLWPIAAAWLEGEPLPEIGRFVAAADRPAGRP